MAHPGLIRRQLRFLQLDEAADSKLLGETRELLESSIEDILDELYRHIHQQPELAALFTSDESKVRARRGQKRHWSELLFSGARGQSHLDMMQAAGQAHLRVGLETSPYLAGYCFVLNRFIARLVGRYGAEPAKLQSIVGALNRAAFLDMSFVIDSYIEAKNEDMRELLRRATQFTDDVSALVGALKETAGGLSDTAKNLQALSETSPGIRRIATESEKLTTQVDRLDDRLSQLTAGDRLRMVEEQSSGLRRRLRSFFRLGRSTRD